jgi:hypothetical protein
VCAASLFASAAQADLVINEVVDGTLPGGLPKFVELVNTGASTVDVTAFEMANFNNGSTLPGGGAGTTLTGGPLAAGGYYVVAYEFSGSNTSFSSVYGTAPDLFIGPFVNGDDVLALRDSGTQAVVDVYGVIGVDGTGEVWEYTDGYSWRCGTNANATFDPNDWFFGGPAASYCTAGTSLGGCAAAMSGVGLASASASSGFTLSATGVDDNRSGILFFGTNGPALLPWGGGTSMQCVLGPVRRTGLLNSGGTGGCDGSLSIDFNDWMTNNPAKAPGAGTAINAQAWYRDSGAAKNSNLSDGLTFWVCP